MEYSSQAGQEETLISMRLVAGGNMLAEVDKHAEQRSLPVRAAPGLLLRRRGSGDCIHRLKYFMQLLRLPRCCFFPPSTHTGEVAAGRQCDRVDKAGGSKIAGPKGRRVGGAMRLFPPPLGRHWGYSENGDWITRHN